MTADHASTTPARPSVVVRPGAAVTLGALTGVLAAFMLPAAVPDRPSPAYLVAGLTGAGLLLGLLLAADLARAAAARRAGVRVHRITVGAFGSRLHTVTAGIDEPRTGARVAAVGLLITGSGGAGLAALGWLAPGDSWALAGSVGLWVGGLALLITLSELLPAPRTGGGRLLAAAVYRRTGSRERADMTVARAGVTAGRIVIAAGVALLIPTGAVGLSVAVLGWIALSSGRGEQSRLRTNTVLAGVRVGDVMGPAPERLPGWQAVSAVVGGMAHPAVSVAGRPVFAVVDVDGNLAGVAHLGDLTAVPVDGRDLTPVTRVSVPMPMVPTTTPDELLTDLLPRLAERPAAGCALVLDGTASPKPIGTVGHLEIASVLAAVTSAPTGTTMAPGGHRSDRL
jgi:hypothetical protein